MTTILLFILGWLIIGLLGFVSGTVIDKNFYKGDKPEWKMLPLCLVLGPIIFLVCFRALWYHYFYKRKKNNG